MLRNLELLSKRVKNKYIANKRLLNGLFEEEPSRNIIKITAQKLYKMLTTSINSNSILWTCLIIQIYENVDTWIDLYKSVRRSSCLNSSKSFLSFPLKSWRQTGTKQKTTYKTNCKWLIIKWAQLGLNQRPPDYESGALTSWAMGPQIFGLVNPLNLG